MACLRISRENFFYNLNQIADRTQSIEKVALVLKDNAYGHGLVPMARLAHEAGVRHAVVRTLAEAAAIEGLFETVLVLSDLPRKRPKKGVRIVVNDRSHLSRMPAGCEVELKVDTGMHRNGVALDEADRALEEIEARGLALKGVLTHYRSADEMGSDYFWQRRRFESLRERLEKAGLKGVRWHSHNSAALFRCGDFEEDIARVGIAAYGCLRMPPAFKTAPLKPVASLWADRIASRALPAGARVGYGGEGVLKEAATVSTYDIGYGDGWLRGDAAKPYRLPNGQTLLGRVSMDALSVVGQEERICLFEDAAEAATQFGTVAYEVLVKLSSALPREIV